MYPVLRFTGHPADKIKNRGDEPCVRRMGLLNCSAGFFLSNSKDYTWEVFMTQDQVLGLFAQYDAYLEGHFRLTSGLHSPHYFQCARVLQHPVAAEKLGRELAAKLENIEKTAVDCVLSPAMGGLIIGHELGRALGVRAIFAERLDGRMTLRRFTLKPGERLVVVEDVVTTGGSLLETVKMAEAAGARVVGTCALVDRSGEGPPPVPGLVSLVRADVITYEPENCPLCRQGLELVKPGSRNAAQG